MEITIWGILTGAVLPLLGYIVVHRLTISREEISRHAKASNDFRAKLIELTADMPDESKYWDNGTLEKLPKVVKEIHV